MSERSRPTSALAGLPAINVGEDLLEIAERPFLGKIALRGDAADRGFTATVARSLGGALPRQPGAGTTRGPTSVLCLAPDEWLVVVDGDARDAFIALRDGLVDQFAAVVDVGSATATVRISGRRACDLLRKICSIDIKRQTERVCWQTRLGPFAALIQRCDANATFDLHVPRSYARSFWRWLDDAAAEFGRCDGG